MALCDGGQPTILGLGAPDQGVDPRAQLAVGPIGGDHLTLKTFNGITKDFTLLGAKLLTSHPLTPLEIDDALLHPEFHEPDSIESLHQNISQLSVCSNFIHIDHTILNAFTNVMKVSINVFAPLVKH